jgi:hypothetical protein
VRCAESQHGSGRSWVPAFAAPALPDRQHRVACATCVGADRILTYRVSFRSASTIEYFIEHFIDLIEARYGDQIHRYCDDRSAHTMVDPEPMPGIDDLPF